MNNFRKIIEEQNKKIEILIQNSKEKKKRFVKIVLLLEIMRIIN